MTAATNPSAGFDLAHLETKAVHDVAQVCVAWRLGIPR